MLLKTDKYQASSNNGKGKRSMSQRIHRKTLRVGATKPGVSGKRVQIGKRISLGKNQKQFNASFPPTTSSFFDNSNDSGLGFEHNDHNESQHIFITQHQSNNNSQIMALTTAASNSSTSVSYQRSMNNISRYGEATASYAPASTATSFSRAGHENKVKHGIQFGAGKKIKNAIKKPFMPVKNNTNHLTLKHETEDTCGDDFFSTHVQKNNTSPTKNSSNRSSSPSTASSSPILSSSSRSSPEITNDSLKASDANDTLEDVTTLSLTSLQNSNHSSISQDGSIQLQIVTQPEQQHRARYQTEGSRGAVKDKSGNGFPVVKLNGYSKPATLQVFIGNDVGKVSPHIFYQACKVSGKNSTPCNEVKVDGTMVIEIEIKPENDMTVICDCVGILKERNVDVEHRLGKNNALASTVTRNKKKSTKCRMIFRAKINEDAEYPETLQICSNIITCTQPPGVPEICKKSLDSCSSIGGQELFIIGKNFLKDTKITFVRYDEACNNRQHKKVWEETVLPDKEYLQQTHLICTVPAYKDEDITEPVQVQVYVTSSNKKSEPHSFIYLPLKKYCCALHHQPNDTLSTNITFNTTQQDVTQTPATQNVLSMTWNLENDPQVVTSPESIMPPPLTGISSRKPSFSKSLSEPGSTNDTKNNDLQETATSSPLQSSPVSVKEMIFNESALMNVSGQCYMNPAPSMMDTNQVVSQVPLLDDYSVVHHIKTEQNTDQQQNMPVVMSNSSQNQDPSPATSALNSAQQQQVVENFINMICAQVEPVIVQQNNDSMINHLNQELIASGNVASNNSVIPADQNMISAINASQPMICEQNILSVQLDGTNIMPLHNPLDPTLPNEASSNTTLISNAVSEAAAETQAVVKQMIASVAAEILSENPNETQTSINNFISNTIGQVTQESTQSQATSSQQQQLQEIIAQELMTPVMIKKEENDGRPTNVQDALINDTVTNNPSSSNMNQPFSPTPDFNLTSMSESDLISFINPSVFI